MKGGSSGIAARGSKRTPLPRELFTPDAVYREQPFDPPFAAATAIADYWSRVTATERDIELRYGRPVAEGNRGGRRVVGDSRQRR